MRNLTIHLYTSNRSYYQINQPQGRRNGFVIGGGGKKNAPPPVPTAMSRFVVKYLPYKFTDTIIELFCPNNNHCNIF